TMRRTFAHETVHACLAMTGRWPAWLHEGLAQKLSGDALNAAARQKVAAMIRSHELPKLENLGQDWSHLDAEHAAAAYSLALAAADALAATPDAIPTLVHHPERLAAVTIELDKRLGL
ncbi:MAG: DUF1570 domain-containing protein, partial [Acidobacteriia bacterium]|nr:DUF1570 domain-containing protein [Terriglobia bacterium]